MADQNLNVKISGDSKELNDSLKATAKEIKKVSQEATRAQQTASKNVSKVAEELGKAGTQGAKGLGKMVMGMSSVAAWGGVIVGVLGKIHEAWEAHVVRNLERTIELSKQSSESISDAADENVRKWQNASTAVKNYHQALKQYKENNTATNYVEMSKAKDRLLKSGLPENILTGMNEGNQLQFAHEQELKAIDDALNALNKEQDRLDKEFYKIDKAWWKMTPATRNDAFRKIQSQKTANAKEIENLTKRRLQIKDLTPETDYYNQSRAETHDRIVKDLAEAQQAQVKELENLKKAQASYQQALNNSRRAEQELKNIKEQQKRERKSEMMEAKRERLAKKMSSFGFSLPEDFDVNLRGKALSDRRRQKALDASISDKISRQEAGERVHWTSQERKRIRELQGLSNKDDALERKQNRIETAERKREAKETLNRAKDALKNAKNAEGWWRNTGVPTAGRRYNEARRRTGFYSRMKNLESLLGGMQLPSNLELFERERKEITEHFKSEGQKMAERKKREQEEFLQKRIDWNESSKIHNSKNRASNHGFDPVVRGVLDARTREIEENNSRFLEGIYRNTMGFGDNIYIVK